MVFSLIFLTDSQQTKGDEGDGGNEQGAPQPPEGPQVRHASGLQHGLQPVVSARGGVACWLCAATGLAVALPGLLAMGFMAAMKIV